MDYNGIIQVSILIIISAIAVYDMRKRIAERKGWMKLIVGILITLTIDLVILLTKTFADRPLLWFGLILLAGTLISIYLICRPIIVLKPKE